MRDEREDRALSSIDLDLQQGCQSRVYRIECRYLKLVSAMMKCEPNSQPRGGTFSLVVCQDISTTAIQANQRMLFVDTTQPPTISMCVVNEMDS